MLLCKRKEDERDKETNVPLMCGQQAVSKMVRKATTNAFRNRASYLDIQLNLSPTPGLSSYTPSWIKMNEKRFPRAQLRKAGGLLQTADVVSLFHDEVPQADIKAFSTLMQHLKDLDSTHHTVIMVQVENEQGLLGDSRDSSDAANAVFTAPVPDDLIAFLSSDYDSLHPDLQGHLTHFAALPSSQRKDDWAAIFGPGPYTDELFMAYHYAQYVNRVAAAGAAIYPLPLFTNAWQNSAVPDGQDAVAGGGSMPGEYPSGGCVSSVLDIWQRYAPTLSFLCPDIYMNDYNATCANYRHRGQPLFIPEQRRDAYGAIRMWSAFGTFGAIGVSPFGIDTLQARTCAYTKHYALLRQVQRVVLEAHRRADSSVGFFFDELDVPGVHGHEVVRKMLGGYELTIQRAFVFGKATAGSGMVIHSPPSSADADASTGAGTSTHKSTFLLIGSGFQVKFAHPSPKAHFTGLLSLTEQRVCNAETGEMKAVRRLNGDETRSGAWAMMPVEDPDYAGYPIAITVPMGTGIVKCEAYALLRG